MNELKIMGSVTGSFEVVPVTPAINPYTGFGARNFDKWAYGHMSFENEVGTSDLTVINVGTGKRVKYHIPWLEGKNREEAKLVIEGIMDEMMEVFLQNIISEREKWFKDVSRSK